jgi:ABC-type multidrug transport system ATPase subunit
MAQPIDKPVEEKTAAILIRAENLGKKFNTGWLFSGFHYTFSSGNTYAVTGPNGSGKSTLLQILWGQMPPTQGKLTFEVYRKPIDDISLFHQVAIATPYMDLIDEFTLKEMVGFHFRLKPALPGYSTSRIIEEMCLADATNKPIGNFSSGMKQRLKLGLAFYTDVPAVFLDEPGTNLDDKAFAWYLNLVKNHAKNRLLIIASNNNDEYPAEASIISLIEYK